MTKIRVKGFIRKLELGEELAELEQVHNLHISPEPVSEHPDDDDDLREVAWLRKEVADMREGLSTVAHAKAREVPQRAGWSVMQFAAVIGAPLLFGVAFKKTRLKDSVFPRKWTI